MRSDFSNGLQSLMTQGKMHQIEKSHEPMFKDCNGAVEHNIEHICFMIIETFCFRLRGKNFPKGELVPLPNFELNLINICFILS